MPLDPPRTAQFPLGPLFPELPYDFVVIAASSGGITAIKQVLCSLPAHFPIPIAIVQHIGLWPSRLVEIFSGHSQLAVKFATDGERLRGGCVYIAPVDRH